ncbi:TPA: hypothetical protein J1383_005299 [Escherichia coli]|nr:hypothetical protein [Escherichia coli]HBA8276526.1 hypothetical protein [Escherichia coli]HBA9461931.1 hypothetical protein [Escherichia coli]
MENVRRSEENATSSEQSAQAAAGFASAAEQAKDKIEETLEFTTQDIINILSGIAEDTEDEDATDAWYGVGSIVLAAYNGAGNADTIRKIKRGNSYPGSRLTAAEFSSYGASGTDTKFTSVSVYLRGPGSGGMPGTYRALSGDEIGSAGSSSVMIGLFIRIA